jgi:o-succinylbenzoate---CoA ligase
MAINWLTQQSIHKSSHLALVFSDRAWTFAELETASIQIARNLIKLGIKQADYVAVLADNCPESVVLIHALTKLHSKLHCIFVSLNTRLSVRELQWQIQDAQANFLIYSPTKLEIVNQLKQEHLTLLNLDVLASDTCELTNLTTDLIEDRINLDSVQIVIYTSGTTGLPKGVRLTYKNHFASAIATEAHLKINPNCDRWLNCLPLFHIGGLSIVWRSVIWGIPMILLPKFDVSKVCAAIAIQKITFISLVPTMLVRILASSDFLNTLSAWQNLRGILLGGASATEELITQCLELQLPIMLTYGLTEAASQVSTLLTKDILAKTGSSGQALNCNQVRIVCFDRDQVEVEVGAIGQILIKGDNVMKGYLNQPNLEENYLNTGDIGYLDKNNYLYVLNRRTDLIISGGENIYPSEIETILIKHPYIQTACAIGIADKEWGQIVVAVVKVIKLEINLEEVREFCLSAGLSKYKLPKRLYFIDAMPTTANGKVSRELVRKLMLS